jgi:hypothetical protein
MNRFAIGTVIDGVGRIADDLITTDKERLEMALREKEFDTQILSKVHETNIAEAQQDPFRGRLACPLPGCRFRD